MYNGIGLTTPRGSGTNGYVQRNISFIARMKDKISYRTEDDLKKLDALANKKPNEGILAHEKKRIIELKCLQLQEQLEDDGFDNEYVEAEVSKLRESLYDKDASLKHEVPKDDFGRPLVKESHQLAEANQEKNMKMREALGISQYFVEGSSLDPEHKAKEAAAEAAAQAEAQKKYTLVPDSSSSSSEREAAKEKPRKKKSLKKSEEPVAHKKKKTAKKDRRERSESVDEKKKKKSKRTLKEKSKCKRDKYHNRSNSSSSSDSDTSVARDSSSSPSNKDISSSSEAISSSDDERQRSSSRQKRKKHSSKYSKSQKEKKSSKKLSNSESSSHHKDRKSRKDKYEMSKKKKSAKESLKRVESSSDSSDADSHTEQYYRLEPVFVKSKSKHKRGLIDIQSKKRNILSAHDKYDEKKRKRKYSSSSSKSDDSVKHVSRKRHKHSLSPLGKDKHHYEKTKANSDKHGEKSRNSKKSKKHQKHDQSSSDEPDLERSNRFRSSSRSLSYSPLPNSRGTRHFSKRGTTASGTHDYVPYKEILLSESDRQKMMAGKAVLDIERSDYKSTSRHSKDSKSRRNENSNASSDDSRVKERHNGYHKSYSAQKSPSLPSVSLRKRHDSSSSESDDYAAGKRSKREKQISLRSSPIRQKAISPSPSSPFADRKKLKRTASSSSGSDSSDFTEKLSYDKKKGSRRYPSPTRRSEIKEKFSDKSKKYHSRSRSSSPHHVEKSKHHYKTNEYNMSKSRSRKSHSSSSQEHDRHSNSSSKPNRSHKKSKETSESSSHAMTPCKNNLELLKHLYETSNSAIGKKSRQRSNSRSSSSNPPADRKSTSLRNLDPKRKQTIHSRDTDKDLPLQEKSRDMNIPLHSLEAERRKRNAAFLALLNRKNLGSDKSVIKSTVESEGRSPEMKSFIVKDTVPQSRGSGQHSEKVKNAFKMSPSQSPSLDSPIRKNGSNGPNNRSLQKDENSSKNASPQILQRKFDGSSRSSISPKSNGRNTKCLTPVMQQEDETRKNRSLSRSPSFKVDRSHGSHSKSPAFEKLRAGRSRESSISTGKRRSRTRSRSGTESKSRSRSPSDSRSRSRSRSRSSSRSKSRSRSQSKSYSSSSS